MRPIIISMLLLLAPIVGAVQLDADAAQGDIDMAVVLDAGEQSGSAKGTVRVHAGLDVVWSLITSCPESMTLFPGLVSCDVLQTAPDHSWQLIRHVMDYSWYVPTVTYVVRASYRKLLHVGIERVSGDLRTLRGSWDLQKDGDYTLAHYQVDLAPGFWVPRWVVHAALKRDLPKMLRALRSRAEARQIGRR